MWREVKPGLVSVRLPESSPFRLSQFEGELTGCSLQSALVLSPQEILPLRLTFHPARYIVRDKALLRSFRGIAFI
jgi:hypothetical protein